MSRASTPSSELAKPVQPTEEESTFLKGPALVLVTAGVMLSIFLIALDQTIVSTALPVVASKFDALADISWIPAAFLLTQAPFLLVYGQFCTLFPVKHIYILAVTLFEIGSLLSGVATSVGFLIFARAFQGIGAAGIFVCAITITADIIPLQTRPKFFGLFGALFGVSSILGPLLGGVFVDHVSWRWCFYINLPLSVPTFVFCIRYIKSKPPRIDRDAPANAAAAQPGQNRILHACKHILSRLAMLDWVAAILILGCTTSLVLAIQWGGNTKPWKSADVIATFCLFGVLAVLFIVWERYRGDKALLPLELFNNRSQVGACLVGLFTRMAFFVPVYYLPLYFQAVKGHSPIKSGLDLIPITLAVVGTAGAGGFFVSKTGRYWHVLVLGPLVGAVGFGLAFTLTETSSWGKIIGYQILMGVGVGCTLQMALIAVQANIPQALVPQATGLVSFSQFLGAIIGIAIAGSIFQNKLATGLREFAPDAPFDLLRQSVEALHGLPLEQRAGALHAYVIALRWAIGLIGVIASVLTSLSALIIRDINLRDKTATGGSRPSNETATPVTSEKASAVETAV